MSPLPCVISTCCRSQPSFKNLFFFLIFYSIYIYLFISDRFAQLLKLIVIGAGGMGFDSRAGQIGHSVAYGSPPLRRFFRAVLSRRYAAEMNPATCYNAWAQYREHKKDLIFFFVLASPVDARCALVC